MSVSWQNNEYYRNARAAYKDTGTPVLTQQNPYGQHTFLGGLVANVLPGLLIGGVTRLTGINIGGILSGVMSIASCFRNQGPTCYSQYPMNSSIFDIARNSGMY